MTEVRFPIRSCPPPVYAHARLEDGKYVGYGGFTYRVENEEVILDLSSGEKKVFDTSDINDPELDAWMEKWRLK